MKTFIFEPAHGNSTNTLFAIYKFSACLNPDLDSQWENIVTDNIFKKNIFYML